jgi:hypothetical protein
MSAIPCNCLKRAGIIVERHVSGFDTIGGREFFEGEKGTLPTPEVAQKNFFGFAFISAIISL